MAPNQAKLSPNQGLQHEMAKRTLYCQYDVPAKVGMSLSFLEVPEGCPTSKSKRGKWFSYRSGCFIHLQKASTAEDSRLKGSASSCKRPLSILVSAKDIPVYSIGVTEPHDPKDMTNRTKLFISYSHEDIRWLKAVKEQLAVLEHEGLLDVYEDTQLEAGEAWLERLHSEMSTAKVGLLLISAPFLSSGFIRNEEVPRLFARHAKGGMSIYPLLVRPCPWQAVKWLSKLQIRPQDVKWRPKPVSTYSGAARDQVLADVVSEIARMVTASGSGQAPSNESRGAAASTSTDPGKSKDGIQKPPIRFTMIRLFPGNESLDGRPWDEVDPGVFRRNFELAADPMFDIMVANNTGVTLVLLRVGIRILQRTRATGGTMGFPKPVKTQSKLSIHCHEDWKHFDLSNDQSWIRFPDPIVMKKNDLPFRFTLLLENFCDIDSASSSEVQFCLEMDNTTAESESIRLLQ
jgi:hypothetical protein